MTTMPETPPILALFDGEHTYYLLPHRPFGDPSWDRLSTTWSTGDGGLVLHRKGDANSGTADWYRAPGAPQSVTATRSGKRTRTGWKLSNPAAASDVYPEFVPDVGPRDDEAVLSVLYDAVYEQNADDVMTIHTDEMVITAEGAAPAPYDGLHYTTNVLDELKHHPELGHLFPGHLTGFREAVVEAVKAQPYMHRTGGGLFGGSHVAVDRDNPGYVTANRSVPYEPRHTKTVHDETGRGRKSRRGREVVESKRLQVSLRVPSAITGANRAEAVVKWHATMADILAEVEEALTPAPCWHCQGTGVVSAKAAAGVGA